jgi:Flp pilus assembly protein TadG
VEFAMVLPFLLLLLLGILEAAWMGRAQLTAGNAAREGARMAGLGKSTADIKSRVQFVGSFLSLQTSEITLTYSTDNGVSFPNTLGDSSEKNNAPASSLIKVQVAHPHRALTGFFSFLKNYKDQAQCVMRREAN